MKYFPLNPKHTRSFQYLAAQFERVDLLPLLGQGLVHATKVVAHHAQLVFVAPLRCSQLILRERPWRHICSAAADVRGLCGFYLQARDVLTGQFDVLAQGLSGFLSNS